MNRPYLTATFWILLNIQLTLMGWLLPLAALLGSYSPWKWLGLGIAASFFGFYLWSLSQPRPDAAGKPRERPLRRRSLMIGYAVVYLGLAFALSPLVLTILFAPPPFTAIGVVGLLCWPLQVPVNRTADRYLAAAKRTRRS